VVFLAIRTGLAGSLHWVFLGAAIVLASALLAALFMHEIPLRGRGSPSSSSAAPSEGAESRLPAAAVPKPA
jgi:hypothetical protein